jgi:hypothetical protein
VAGRFQGRCGRIRRQRPRPRRGRRALCWAARGHGGRGSPSGGATALAARRNGQPPRLDGMPGEVINAVQGNELRAEAASLILVSRAFRRSPIVGRIAGRVNARRSRSEGRRADRQISSCLPNARWKSVTKAPVSARQYAMVAAGHRTARRSARRMSRRRLPLPWCTCSGRERAGRAAGLPRVPAVHKPLPDLGGAAVVQQHVRQLVQGRYACGGRASSLPRGRCSRRLWVPIHRPHGMPGPELNGHGESAGAAAAPGQPRTHPGQTAPECQALGRERHAVPSRLRPALLTSTRSVDSLQRAGSHSRTPGFPCWRDGYPVTFSYVSRRRRMVQPTPPGTPRWHFRLPPGCHDTKYGFLRAGMARHKFVRNAKSCRCLQLLSDVSRRGCKWRRLLPTA